MMNLPATILFIYETSPLSIRKHTAYSEQVELYSNKCFMLTLREIIKQLINLNCAAALHVVSLDVQQGAQ